MGCNRGRELEDRSIVLNFYSSWLQNIFANNNWPINYFNTCSIKIIESFNTKWKKEFEIIFQHDQEIKNQKSFYQ